ncbi:MAG: hypothetical protein QNK03_18790 [Myxococcota bacterium]|nr:hypothetical protein [Myxococcota bacterium]
MRFALEYSIAWAHLDQAIARRIDWDEIQPEDFRFEAEYVWPDADGGFRGVAIVEVGSVDALHSLIVHYGPVLTLRASPASDVLSSIARFREGQGGS